MRYITGKQALNLPCSLETVGDWHANSIRWRNLNMRETNGSLFGTYGIEVCSSVPEHKGEFFIADTLRAILDLLEEGRFDMARGCRDEIICNSAYTKELFSKVSLLKGTKNWFGINNFMYEEYSEEWLHFYNGSVN